MAVVLIAIVAIAIASRLGGSDDTPVAVAPTTTPSAPSIALRVQEDGTIEVTVDPPADEAPTIIDYSVEYSRNGTDWTALDKPPARFTRITIPDLPPNRRYRVRVAARNQVGIGPWSAEETVDVTRTCSPEEFEELTSDYIDLSERTISAAEATPDVLTPTAGARRIGIRYGREQRKVAEIIRECGIVDPHGAAGADVVAALRDLNLAAGRLYRFLIRYYRTEQGSAETYSRLVDDFNRNIDDFNAAWRTFGESAGFRIDDTPDAPIDESTAPD